jgi:hypothetical protein
LLSASIPLASGPSIISCFNEMKTKELKSWSPKNCNNPLVIKLIKWLREDLNGEESEISEFARRDFLKSYSDFLQEKEQFILALQKGRRWNVRSDGFYFLEDFGKVLTLPQLNEQREKISRQLNQIY